MEPSSAATTGVIAKRRIPWLEWMLVIVGQALFFQAFPDAWPRLGSAVLSMLRPLVPVAHFLWAIVDVGQWSLIGAAIRLTIILLFLVGLKAWKDRAN